ncbi:hypothetical protein KKG45_00920 [bacterium]|nr:hypothetical protein [bacterium]
MSASVKMWPYAAANQSSPVLSESDAVCSLFRSGDDPWDAACCRTILEREGRPLSSYRRSCGGSRPMDLDANNTSNPNIDDEAFESAYRAIEHFSSRDLMDISIGKTAWTAPHLASRFHRGAASLRLIQKLETARPDSVGLLVAGRTLELDGDEVSGIDNVSITETLAWQQSLDPHFSEGVARALNNTDVFGEKKIRKSRMGIANKMMGYLVRLWSLILDPQGGAGPSGASFVEICDLVARVRRDEGKQSGLQPGRLIRDDPKLQRHLRRIEYLYYLDQESTDRVRRNPEMRGRTRADISCTVRQLGFELVRGGFIEPDDKAYWSSGGAMATAKIGSSDALKFRIEGFLSETRIDAGFVKGLAAMPWNRRICAEY